MYINEFAELTVDSTRVRLLALLIKKGGLSQADFLVIIGKHYNSIVNRHFRNLVKPENGLWKIALDEKRDGVTIISSLKNSDKKRLESLFSALNVFEDPTVKKDLQLFDKYWKSGDIGKYRFVKTPKPATVKKAIPKLRHSKIK